MTAPDRSLVVVSAGLGQPSSTRLLADRLAAATERHLEERGVAPRIEVVELREHAQDLANHLLTGFPSPKLQGAIDAILGSEVVPVLRREFEALRPADVPAGPPLHPRVVAAQVAEAAEAVAVA